MTQAPKQQSTSQIFLMIQDPTLIGLYKKNLQVPTHSIVYFEPKMDWKTKLRSSSFDIVILDFSVFPENPIERLQEVQRLAGHAEIIVLAEQEEAPTIVAAFKSGIADFYLKPTTAETLNWAIEKILSRQSLTAKTTGLTADMEVFNAVHNIHIAEDDSKMRELAGQTLIQEIEAAGALWVWVDAGKLSNVTYTRKTPYQIKPIYCENTFAFEQLEAFIKQYPGHLEASYAKGITKNADAWKQGPFVWIPSQNQNLGGILLFGVNQELTPQSKLRIEFLFRNLDASLEQYQRYKLAKEQTYLDDLTGLYNSRFLELTLSTLVSSAESEPKPFCLLFIDIDHFKQINDKNGHLVGSQTLAQIAKTLKSTLRKYDQVFRYGGDEFVVILHQITEGDSLRTANRLRSQIENRIFVFNQVEIKVTLSIGVSYYKGDHNNYEALLKLADQALYESKKRGRNRVLPSQAVTPKKKTGT